MRHRIEQTVASLCSENVVWQDSAAPQTLKGREAAHQIHRDVKFSALPDAQGVFIKGPYIALDGTAAAARLRIIGTMTPTGGLLEFETAAVSRFAGGLMSVFITSLRAGRACADDDREVLPVAARAAR